jgi:hypothetical protein
LELEKEREVLSSRCGRATKVPGDVLRNMVTVDNEMLGK